jgi:hypothetical protein
MEMTGGSVSTWFKKSDYSDCSAADRELNVKARLNSRGYTGFVNHE